MSERTEKFMTTAQQEGNSNGAAGSFICFYNHKSIRFSNPFFQFRIQFHNGGGLQGCWAQVQLKTLKIPAASGLVKLTRLVPGVVHRQGSILPCQHHSFPLWLVTAKVF